MDYPVDPFIRTPNAPTAPPAPSSDPAELLRTARWHCGLTQSELANRAETSQQAVARYEKGTTVPSVAVLERLLAACGMYLEMTVRPEPGLIDAPTRDLLDKEPLLRLTEERRESLLAMVRVLRDLGLPVLVVGKAAARLRGALVRVYELEFAVDEAAPDVRSLEEVLEAAGCYFVLVDERAPVIPSGLPRLDRVRLISERSDVVIRGVPDWDVQRCGASALETSAGLVEVASPAIIPTLWPTRDRDHLAFQRALQLRSTMREAAPL